MVATNVRDPEPLKGLNGLGKLTGIKVIIQQSQNPCDGSFAG